MKAKKIHLSKHDFLFVAISIFLLGIISGLHLAPQNIRPHADLEDERVVSMLLPAVDSEGNGVIGILSTTVKPGTGKILVDSSKVLNYIDTQLSARIAATAASNYKHVSLENIDVTYVIDVNASIIEGPSAGSAMAVSVLLALENRTSKDIAMTGTINPDGTIGRVGAIYQKALAAKDSGAKIFLVPVGQSSTEITNRTRVCESRRTMQICRINYNTRNVNIGEELNIMVQEVGTLEDAYRYFTDTE